MQGRIIRQISNLYTVKVGDMLYGCRARGKFRKNNISPMVGDNVIINPDDNVIEDVLDRKNELDRPVIANVDMAFIVTSAKKPNLDLVLLDKLISVITFNDIQPVICFTKLDLLNPVEKENIDNLKKYYEMIGIDCVYNTDTAEIKRLLDNNIVVLAGQTGAGKSSLLNRLDDELDIVDRLSKVSGIFSFSVANCFETSLGSINCRIIKIAP